MNYFYSICLSLTLALSGCATKQEVLVTKSTQSKQINSVSIVPADGNSAVMTANLENALVKQGLVLKGSSPQGTTKSPLADVLISYVDVWRWDIVMYLQKLNIKVFDAESGDLLVIGQWSDSAFHGFRDAKLVTEQLTAEVMAKIRAPKN